MLQRFPMTLNGEKQLRKELERLINVERPRISATIATAREIGDLKENAEYHSAKEQQSFVEGRITEIENRLSNAQVIDITKLTQNGRVVFGSTVVLTEVKAEKDRTLTIVGEDESDLKKNKISINSPIARGLIGKNINDTATITTPAGEVEYSIKDVLYI